MSDFYNGNKLLSLLDLDGKKPEVYLCCGNRTAGKTYFFKRWMLRRALKHDEKFVVFVRFIDDLPNVVDGFFADIGPIEWPRHVMEQKPIMHGKAQVLEFDGKRVGYVIALNDPERIKRNSAIFADAARGFMDEFMSETGKYVPKEIEKFNSIRLSIARGGASGQHARYFPVYLCSNNVTVFNPYFEAFGIAGRIHNRTKYMRGHGWALEQTFNERAAEAIRENFRTMSAKELEYATKNKFLLDDSRFVSDIPGVKICIAAIRRGDKYFGVWIPPESSKIFVSRKYDPQCPIVLALDEIDHEGKSILLDRSHPAFKFMRKMYANGLCWFADGASRHAFIEGMCFT